MDLSRPLSTTFTVNVDMGDQTLTVTFDDINLAFDNVLRFTDMLDDPDLPNATKVFNGLIALVGYESTTQLYEQCSEQVYKIFADLVEQIFDTKDSSAGFVDLNGDPMPVPKQDKTMDIKQDGEFIYSSFLFDYQIDLFEAQGKLDYRKFKALLQGLSDDSKMQRVAHIRGMDLPKKGKAREQIKKAKEYYKLRG